MGTVAPAAATSLGTSEEAGEEDKPCVVIRTDPPDVIVGTECSSGGIAQINDWILP